MSKRSNLLFFLLVNAFALYESWANSISTTLSLSSNDVKFVENNLQFPTNGNKGLHNAIARATSSISIFTQNLFYLEFIKNPRNSLSNIENLLICFRFFKELRNCLMHSGGIADSKLLEAYGNYSALTITDLGIKELPHIIAPILNKPVTLNLRGIVGLYDAMLRIVATIDAELSVASVSESIMINRFKAVNSRKHTLGAQDQERAIQVKRIFGSIGMPVPSDLYKAERFLRDYLLVS